MTARERKIYRNRDEEKVAEREITKFTLTWSRAFLITLPTSCLHSPMSGLYSSRLGEKDKSSDLKNSVKERGGRDTY